MDPLLRKIQGLSQPHFGSTPTNFVSTPPKIKKFPELLPQMPEFKSLHALTCDHHWKHKHTRSKGKSSCSITAE
jgi:hypothetical protein